MARTRTRVGVVIFTAIIVTLIGVSIGGYFYREHMASTKYSPARQVERYLDAVVEGRADAVVKLHRPGDAGSELTLMTEKIAKSAEQRPSSYTLGEVTTTGKNATVEAYLTMDGKNYPVKFKLVSAGTADVFFDRWKIVEAPEQNLYVGHIPHQLEINGIAVELPVKDQKVTQRGADSFPVLPGTYTISAPKGSKYISFGEDQQVTVLPASASAKAGADEAVEFSQSYTPALEADVKADIEAHINQCFSSTLFEPPGCEDTLYMDDYGPAITGIQRSWKESPGFDWYPPDDEMSEPGRMVLSGGDMRIKYKWRWEADESWEDDQDTRYIVFGYGEDTWVEVTMVSDDSYKLTYHGF